MSEAYMCQRCGVTMPPGTTTIRGGVYATLCHKCRTEFDGLCHENGYISELTDIESQARFYQCVGLRTKLNEPELLRLRLEFINVGRQVVEIDRKFRALALEFIASEPKQKS
jgi:hypothetical protein